MLGVIKPRWISQRMWWANDCLKPDEIADDQGRHIPAERELDPPMILPCTGMSRPVVRIVCTDTVAEARPGPYRTGSTISPITSDLPFSAVAGIESLPVHA